ncbi:uncharacterized protein LOC113325114 [Papaver somniferum]|uniref:uncharacterized protein LOC113325114 n=1 Tax=Papaver somniferum TaxID=3469 RepID=UPI000E704F1B|nr:uncharacterized protein LOC113325114 [Papaver somniferum]
MVMLWNEEEVNIQTTSQSRWPIHAVVTAKFHRPWIMSTIYASTNKVCRKRLWDEVNGVGGIQDTERMVMGDLNTIGSGKEKVGGRKPTANQLEELKNVMNKNGLIDLGAHGPKWTWKNKRVSLANIKERLSRVMANVMWCNRFANAQVSHLPYFNSDHRVILVDLEPKKEFRHRPYRL